ncbi:MAG: helix-turn-helix transcriptional regulator [Clostridia bacterium]|nr:helix-turn-helix transcriptional regulator [Clostridia bacterium]
MENFGNRLTKLRKDKGLSLEDLAKDLNFHKITLNMWENSKKVLSISKLIKIAKYFNVSVDYLLGL